MKKTVVIISAALLFTSSIFSQTNPSKTLPQLGKSSIKEVVAAMTLEEKIQLVVGTGMRLSDVNAPTDKPTTAKKPDTVPEGLPEGIFFEKGESKVPGAAGILFNIPRLGIPSIVLADGPAGLRINPKRSSDSLHTYYCTAFPVATLLASSWDTDLLQSVGASIGNEVHEYGVDVILGPGLNIHRNPLGGRNFEYYSEDPYLTGKMTVAMVKGVQSQGVGTSIKHFAANNQESNRMGVNTVVSPRAMREIYLPGFEMAVREAQPWTVMSSYNKLNGPYTSENPELLNNVLRQDWGFGGLVMSDWFGGTDPVAQMKAGNDLLMPGTSKQMESIKKAIEKGELSEAVLDQNVARLLELILKTPTFKGYKYSNKPDLQSHAQVARKAATEGMILLKNENNTLPLANNIRTIAAFGNTSYDILSGGTGSGDVNEAYTVSLVDGLNNTGYQLAENLQKAYSQFVVTAKAARPPKKTFFELEAPIAEMVIDRATIEQNARTADVALLTIGRNAGEFQDRKLEADYYLTATEKTLIKTVSEIFHAKGKKLIVILNIGGVVEVASWRDDVDAILLAWQGGQETGNAIADLLSGKVNPSGKLATTFPVDYANVPSAKNFPGTPADKPAEVVYEEGIYTGYRYYDAYGVAPAYPFGFGLSYTKFSYNNLKISSKYFNEVLTITVDITNIGTVAGKEVVQLYLSAPSEKVDKPMQELKCFSKTALLKPGEKQTITFKLEARALASFNTGASTWVAEAGTYTVKIGASSRDIRQTGNFLVEKEMMVKKESQSLAAPVELQEWKK